VWRWQERFMAQGIDGLLRDKTRPARIAALPVAVRERAVALTLSNPPGETTHWTAGLAAQQLGISVSSVQRIWRAHGLQPHRVRQFKLSRDGQFVEKLRNVVGLYVDPPAHGAVYRREVANSGAGPHPAGLADEEGPLRHHDPRLQAARHHHPLRRPQRTGRQDHRPLHAASPSPGIHTLLNTIEADIPAGKMIHVVLDNYATHKHPKVRAWLARHPRFVFHFTPTSASWLNAVEGFFAKLTRRRLKRGVFRSIVDLQAAINRFLKETNDHPKPFVWTADPDKIIAAVRRGYQALDAIH
jgi:hypothetical protein